MRPLSEVVFEEDHALHQESERVYSQRRIWALIGGSLRQQKETIGRLTKCGSIFIDRLYDLAPVVHDKNIGRFEADETRQAKLLQPSKELAKCTDKCGKSSHGIADCAISLPRCNEVDGQRMSRLADSLKVCHRRVDSRYDLKAVRSFSVRVCLISIPRVQSVV